MPLWVLILQNYLRRHRLLQGLHNEEPCDHRVRHNISSIVQNLGAPELTRDIFPAAATSSAAAASSSQTSTKTSSAQSKTTTSTSSDHIGSSSNLPAASSQTSPTTSSGLASSTTSSTSAQTPTPVAVISSAPVGTARPSLPSHSNTAAIAAGTVGAIIGAIIALIVTLLVLRWHKRRAEDNSQATQRNNGLRLQGSDVNGAGSAFQDKDGSGK